MSSVESLSRQVQAIRTRVGRPEDPKHWVFMMVEGREIPACVASQLGPYDTAIIHEVMPGYLGEDELGSCTVITSRGNCIVSMETGEWTRVQQGVRGSRRERSG